ncbi:hypothetical protein HPX95_19715 [Bacillus tequilensis]|uniref:hypothetical protein n=1 Tax=Bacillus tequilensis TaxID=227866 RepID=UPI001575D4F6|nr:hypothetical protein [Bacillus tequilensis]NTU28367.1 hypothetical protein [Bacillus tequilensis]
MAKLEGVKTLDMVNGEITKVAYGGAEYERVEGEAKAGDIGLRIDKPTSYATVGAFYQFVYDLGGLSFIDDVGDKPYVAGNHFAIFRKVASTNPSIEDRVTKAEGEIESLKSDVAALKGETKPERLKVGDYAKVVQERHHQNGEVIILRVSGSEQFPFQSERLDGTPGDIFGHRHLVRATDEEVAEAKDAAARAKFKRGAKVRLLSGGWSKNMLGFDDGKIYTVVQSGVDSYGYPGGNKIKITGAGYGFKTGVAAPDQLEILTEEEAAEIERQQAEEAKWAKIGRKIGEYEVGDIVQLSESAGVLGIMDFIGSQFYGVQLPNGDYARPDTDEVTLITPVEARFDR